MTTTGIFRTPCALSAATILFLLTGTAHAAPAPVNNPNGTIAGSIDGHDFELPVQCLSAAGSLDVSSHDQPISNSVTIGGVEPAVSILAFEIGFQVVIFIGGERYKFLRTRSTIDAFPFTLKREVRAGKLGKVEVDLTLVCPDV